MHSPPLVLRPTLCLALLALAPASQAEKLVVTRSTAAGDYLQKRIADGKRAPQTYVFMAGRYFPGRTHDNSLDKMPFRTIAERLALDLREQAYSPAASLAKADLLLVVHWGVTNGSMRDMVSLATSMEALANTGYDTEVARTDYDEAVASGDLEAIRRARDNLDRLDQQANSELQDIRLEQYSGGEDSAMLIGLSAELRREDTNPFGSEHRKTLVGMTQEERYFVVVMAYDVPTLVRARKLNRVWTLRASISSAGVNFPQALDRISNTAGHYFGVRQEGVAFDYTGDRQRKESVKLGELVVIGTVDR